MQHTLQTPRVLYSTIHIAVYKLISDHSASLRRPPYSSLATVTVVASLLLDDFFCLCDHQHTAGAYYMPLDANHMR